MTIIPRANVNIGFDFEEAIFEAIDDAFEAAQQPTKVDCWFFKEGNQYSYLIGDKAGGANYEKLFKIASNRKFSDQYTNEEQINESTSVFGAGSLSHSNISNEVWFFTIFEGKKIALSAIKDLSTGDVNVEISNISAQDVLLNNNIHVDGMDVDGYDSLLYVRKYNHSTNQKVNDFKTRLNFKGLKKNLRSTYADKLENGYQIRLNGRAIAPLDIFYKEKLEKNCYQVLKFSITLKELLNRNLSFKDEIYKRYLDIFKKDNGVELAEEALMAQTITVTCYNYETKYFNQIYFKAINPNDAVTFNVQTSGFWLFRNGRKIGNPTSLQTMNLTHPSLNNFRASIEFNPIFDLYFGIQVNKNRYVLSEEIQQLIDLKIKYFMKMNNLKKFSELLNQHSFEKMENSQLSFDLVINDIDEESANEGETQGAKNHGEFKNNDTLWKRAEKICIKDQKRLGFIAIDVSNNKKGYDIEAYHPITNEERYIEVKCVNKIGGKFEISEKEYIKAHRISDAYYVCVIVIEEEQVNFTYLRNPSRNLVFEEVIKVIAYLCQEYEGESYTLSLDELGINQ